MTIIIGNSNDYSSSNTNTDIIQIISSRIETYALIIII